MTTPHIPADLDLATLISLTYRCDTDPGCGRKWVYGKASVPAGVPTACVCGIPFGQPEVRNVGDDEAPPKITPPAEPACRVCFDNPPPGFQCLACGAGAPPPEEP